MLREEKVSREEELISETEIEEAAHLFNKELLPLTPVDWRQIQGITASYNPIDIRKDEKNEFYLVKFFKNREFGPTPMENALNELQCIQKLAQLKPQLHIHQIETSELAADDLKVNQRGIPILLIKLKPEYVPASVYLNPDIFTPHRWQELTAPEGILPQLIMAIRDFHTTSQYAHGDLHIDNLGFISSKKSVPVSMFIDFEAAFKLEAQTAVSGRTQDIIAFLSDFHYRTGLSAESRSKENEVIEALLGLFEQYYCIKDSSTGLAMIVPGKPFPRDAIRRVVMNAI